MQNYFKLPLDAARKIAGKYGTPVLVVSRAAVRESYELMKKHIPGVRIHYAMKSNPDKNILSELIELDGCFDVASDGEMEVLAGLKVDPSRIIYANPVKTWNGLHTAARFGVKRMTFDSVIEIQKMAAIVPDAQVLVRVRVDNPQAMVDLNSKFGCYPEEALYLMRKARDAGLDVAGMCFHVGSQTFSSSPYTQGILACKRLYEVAALDGFNLRVLDIGGGFPVPAIGAEYEIEEMLSDIGRLLREKFPQTEIWCEPGRYLCGTAVNLITSVIGNIVKNDNLWYFLDEGLYGTFSGKMFDHWEYTFEAAIDGERETTIATFAGPSCDSIDVILREVRTPKLELNDVLLFPITGAYTSASACTFNGFGLAKSLCWEEIKDTL